MRTTRPGWSRHGMAIPTSPPRRGLLRLLSVLLLARTAGAGAASEFDDGTSPKFPGCDNTLQKVKVMYWVNGDEQSSLTGISARFGAVLPDTAASDGPKRPAVQPDPKGSCAKSAKPLSDSVAVAERGECTFIDKAKTAEAGGAATLVIINDDDGPSHRAAGVSLPSHQSPSLRNVVHGPWRRRKTDGDTCFLCCSSAEDGLHRQGPASQHQHSRRHGVQVRGRQDSVSPL